MTSTLSVPQAAAAAQPDNLAALTRPDFPLLAQTACLGQPLIYLDHAATSQKPRQVLEALQHYYDHDNAKTCDDVQAQEDTGTRRNPQSQLLRLQLLRLRERGTGRV